MAHSAEFEIDLLEQRAQEAGLDRSQFVRDVIQGEISRGSLAIRDGDPLFVLVCDQFGNEVSVHKSASNSTKARSLAKQVLRRNPSESVHIVTREGLTVPFTAPRIPKAR